MPLYKDVGLAVTEVISDSRLIFLQEGDSNQITELLSAIERNGYTYRYVSDLSDFHMVDADRDRILVFNDPTYPSPAALSPLIAFVVVHPGQRAIVLNRPLPRRRSGQPERQNIDGHV